MGTPTPSSTQATADTELQILGAVYGLGKVTARVASLVDRTASPQTLTVTASNAVFSDTWPGIPKTLTVVYRYGADGAPVVAVVQENAQLTIGAAQYAARRVVTPAGAGLPPQLTVYGASYGRGDVTAAVRNLISPAGQTLQLTANNATFTDTWPGVVKAFVIVAAYTGQAPFVDVITENQPYDLKYRPPLRILGATWGRVDVAPTITAAVHRRTLAIAATNAALGVDGWPGVVKTLVVITQYGSEQPRQSIVREGGSLAIDYTPSAPYQPPSDPHALNIVAAAYGPSDQTAKVRSLVAGNALSLTAGNGAFGDSWPGTVKSFVLTYGWGPELPVTLVVPENGAVAVTAPPDPSGPVMEQWHAFFARAQFPIVFSDRDQASLYTHASGRSPVPDTPFLVPGPQAMFRFEAVDANDCTRGYRVVSDGNYVAGLSTYSGPMITTCLATTTDPSQASVWLPVFRSRMTYSMRSTGDGRLMTRPWDWYSGGNLIGRTAVLLAGENEGGWGAIQQTFKMPGWPLRNEQMAYIPTGVHFLLQSGGRYLYANGAQLGWGTATDATAVCAVATPDPGSALAGYALSVGGKYVQMTSVDGPVALVDDVRGATPLCAVQADDGSLAFWHCMSDHALAVKNGVPVFTLLDDPQALAPTWTPEDHGQPPAMRLQSALDTPKSLATTTYLKAIVAGLKSTDPLKRRATWDYSFDNVFAPDWLIATPENAFGDYATFEMPIAAPGANDFGLQACTGGTDPLHPCVTLASSVKTPGGTPQSFHAGHSRQLYEEMYKLITSATAFVDIASLLRKDATPSGEFLAAVRNALTYLSNVPAAQNVIVRLIFGEPLGWLGDTGPNGRYIPGTGPYQSAPDLLAQLTRDIPATTTSKMRVYVAYTSSVPSITWNHAKILAVDGRRAMVGGHNMWAGPYLGANPVLDVSLKLSGLAAVDAHRFADNLWFQQVLQHGSYWVADSASFVAPATKAAGQRAVPATRLFDQWYSEPADNPARESGTGTPVLTVGREEGTPVPSAPSDKALLKLLDLATQSIYISAQAMSHDPIYPRNWPLEFLDGLAAALVRNVPITIFMSDPSGGAYKGDPPADVISQIQNRIVGKTPAQIDVLLQQLSVRSFPPASRWGLAGSPGISNHGKVLMVDKKAFSIGSQNFYPSSPATMSELTYVVEDATLAGTLYDTYFAKMEQWALPAPGAQPTVDQNTYVITLHALQCYTVSESGWGETDPDQCYLSRDGARIWPVNSRYVEMSTGDIAVFADLRLPPVGHLDNPLEVKLWEWDWLSDDLLGHFNFHPDLPLAYWNNGPRSAKLAELNADTIYEARGVMDDSYAVYHLTFSFQRVAPS